MKFPVDLTLNVKVYARQIWSRCTILKLQIKGFGLIFFAQESGSNFMNDDHHHYNDSIIQHTWMMMTMTLMIMFLTHPHHHDMFPPGGKAAGGNLVFVNRVFGIWGFVFGRHVGGLLVMNNDFKMLNRKRPCFKRPAPGLTIYYAECFFTACKMSAGEVE